MILGGRMSKSPLIAMGAMLGLSGPLFGADGPFHFDRSKYWPRSKPAPVPPAKAKRRAKAKAARKARAITRRAGR